MRNNKVCDFCKAVLSTYPFRGYDIIRKGREVKRSLASYGCLTTKIIMFSEQAERERIRSSTRCLCHKTSTCMGMPLSEGVVSQRPLADVAAQLPKSLVFGEQPDMVSVSSSIRYCRHPDCHYSVSSCFDSSPKCHCTASPLARNLVRQWNAEMHRRTIEMKSSHSGDIADWTPFAVLYSIVLRIRGSLCTNLGFNPSATFSIVATSKLIRQVGSLVARNWLHCGSCHDRLGRPFPTIFSREKSTRHMIELSHSLPERNHMIQARQCAGRTLSLLRNILESEANCTWPPQITVRAMHDAIPRE